MKSKKKKRVVAGVLTGLVGLISAAVLGALFYGTMVYQLAGETESAGAQKRAMGTPIPLEQGVDVRSLMPGALLALGEGTLIEEQAEDLRMGGRICRVITRTYALADGAQAQAVTATPAAYLERLSEEEWQPQLITGFVVSGLDAVLALRGERCLLAARDGEMVYMIETDAGQETAYTLGAAAYLEDEAQAENP